jgi:hypothetical protein
MQKLREHIDKGSLAVIIITFVLFVTALFTKGITHDFFVEAGVFLVSVKIIIMSFKNASEIDSLHEKLDVIHEAVHRLEPQGPRQ